MFYSGKQLLYRMLLTVMLLVPLFIQTVGATTFIEIYVFLLAMFGIRAIVFYLFPDKEKE